MSTRVLVSLTLLLAACSGGPARAPELVCERSDPEEVCDVQLGESTVQIVTTTWGTGSTLVSLHDNEQTAVDAARVLLPRHGGRLIELRHSGERRVRFVLGENAWTVDPNRIFTPEGREATLWLEGEEERGSWWSRRGPLREVEKLAAALEDRLFQQWPGSALIAVHNNTDGEYSVDDYGPGGRLAGDAEAVHREPQIDADDFLFVTERGDFNDGRKAQLNTVLQASGVLDDGSLSVFAAREGRSYINVEVQHREVSRQHALMHTVLTWHPGEPPEEPPPWTEAPLPFGETRRALSRAYRELHQGRPFDAEEAVRIAPRLVVVHHTATATAAEARAIFEPEVLRGRADISGAGALNVSAHFLVDRDGGITRLVPENVLARHTIGLNHLAIGIENVGGRAEQPLTEAQLAANERLIRHLASQHPITHLLGHHETNRMDGHRYFEEADPNYRTVKVDPGPEFMGQLRTRLADLGLEGLPAPPSD